MIFTAIVKVIKVHHLFHSYLSGGLEVPILKNVSFEIQSGKLTAIKGPSGSGKSTLLYLIGGFLKPTRGEIEIENRHISNMKGLELAQFRSRKMGFIFQQFHLLPRQSAFGNIALAGKYPVEWTHVRDDVKERIHFLASQLGLSDHLHKKPSQLSGGQQQRVAIARALFNDPDILLADEPTGSLDSRTAQDIFKILREISNQGRAVVIITHDEQIANQCDEVISIRDGEIVEQKKISQKDGQARHVDRKLPNQRVTLWRYVLNTWPILIESLKFNKLRAVLTMLGVSIGIAALISMVTFGTYLRERVISNYEKMGVNKLSLQGYTNWRQKAVDQKSLTVFEQFDEKKDLEGLQKVFPQIRKITPNLIDWSKPEASSGGRKVTGEALPIGVNEDYFSITQRKLIGGKPLSYFHIVNRSPVCVIGYEIAQRLFGKMDPMGNIIFLNSGDDGSYSCQVLGVFEQVSSNSEWDKPGFHIVMPYTYFQVATQKWFSRINNVSLQLAPGSDVENTVKGIKKFFGNKYGSSGIFNVGSDAIMVSQLKQFMGIFQLLLGAIAIICLVVGGMGITNMMLASIGEQLREIGIRKSLGATDSSVYVQYLGESIMLCFVAGIFGILFGVCTYHAVIFLTSKVVKQVEFEWTINVSALLFSFVAIFAVGLLSGWVPALKARRLQVIEALRAE